MARYDYDIGTTSYSRFMDEKNTQYVNLVNRAERLNLENDGEPTTEEAQLYDQAAMVCEEIMSRNLSQRSVHAKWSRRKIECNEQVKRIMDVLAPVPPKPVRAAQEPTEPARNVQTNAAPAAKSAAQTVTTAPDGFTTRYASKSVPLEMIRSWFVDEISSTGFGSVVGRVELKERLMREAASIGFEQVDKQLGINPVQSYLLYGPPGTGKTHLIKAFAYELKKKGFNYMNLVASQIHSGLVGDAEKIVTAAFNVAVEHEPCLLFIDEIDNLGVSRDGKAEGHEKRLTVAFMEAYNKLKDSRKRVIFMCATNHPGKLDEAMLDRFSPRIPIPLPDEDDRVRYFTDAFWDKDSDQPRVVLDDITPEEMGADTDNHGYRDLDNLKNAIIAKLKAIVIREKRVLGPNGETDYAATDELAAQALRMGEVKLTRAIFQETRREVPPSDKSKNRQELREFEERLGNLGS